jgi:hypothetical protein
VNDIQSAIDNRQKRDSGNDQVMCCEADHFHARELLVSCLSYRLNAYISSSPKSSMSKTETLGKKNTLQSLYTI